MNSTTNHEHKSIDEIPDDQHWAATLLPTTLIDEALAYIEGGQS